MKVLITGAGGFIGGHLAESQLANGNEVWALDLDVKGLSRFINRQGLKIVEGDIRDRELLRTILEGTTIVFHLASAHLDVSKPDEHYYEVNVAGTRGLLESAKRAKVQRFVHCSSVGVLGDITKPPADEAYPTNPDNIYERTKLAGELVAKQFSQETGLPIVIARPAWVYGPYCARTEKLIRTIQKGRFVMVGNGQNLRHPIYITDVVNGLEGCSQSQDGRGDVYILAGEEPVTVKELVSRITELLGVSSPTIRLPVGLAKLAGTLLQTAFQPMGRRPPFSRRSVDFFIKNNAYDIRKAKAELGFYPQVDLHSGLERTIEWLKNERNL